MRFGSFYKKNSHLFESFFSFALCFLIILSTTSVYSEAGLAQSIDIFKRQVSIANRIIASHMLSFQSEYSSTAGTITYRSVDLTTGVQDSASNEVPVASIRYGHVATYNATTGGSRLFTTTGHDNEGMYVFEVTFKTATQKSNIHPSLAGKSILFVGYGPGPDHKTIYTTGSTAGRANLQDIDLMSSIGGYLCFLKSGLCTNTTQSKGPLVTCPNANITSINGGVVPGLLLSSASQSNLFSYVSGPLGLCGSTSATRNAMGGVV